jgi:type IV fimbrial biogenesis protein FimT
MKPWKLLKAEHRRVALGFTIVELLVAMVVAGILAAIAIPAFNNFVQNDRDTGQINSLAMSLNLARSEAVKRNTFAGVKVCPSSNGSCNSPAGGWAAGWIVLDLDPSNTLAPVLQQVPALAGTNVLTATGGGANGITFKSNGSVLALLKVKVCDSRGSAYARDIEVTTVGTVTASQNPGYDAAGASLTCP